LEDACLMRPSFIASFLVCIMPDSAPAEIPMPVRSNAALFDAENIVLCSDFEELSASRVSLFLSELGEEVATPNVLDGPASLAKAFGFNVLVVMSGTETQDATQECALNTVPYGGGIVNEVNSTVKGFRDGFVHPNPTINAALGDTLWSSSNYYHEAENWITVVIVVRTSSVGQLDFTMIRLFDLPEAACDQNLACLSR